MSAAGPANLTDDGGQGCRVSATPADATHFALDGQKRPFAHDDLAHLGRLGLHPHRSTFRLSGDPHFVDKPRHHRPLSVAAGPRAGALRRCPIQAARPSQPVLPMLPGMPERPAYKRHGTTSLSQPSMSPRVPSSASAAGATGPGSFSTS